MDIPKNNKINKRIKRQETLKHRKSLIIDIFIDFAKNTSLHGLKYVNERGSSWIEKLFWLITFIISCGLCYFLIQNVYTKWRTSPVIVSFNEEMISVGAVSMPSLTICPQLKNKQSVYNYTDFETKLINELLATDYTRILNLTNTDYELENFTSFKYSSLVCSTEYDEFEGKNTSDSSIVDHIIKVAPRIDEVFYFCILWDKTYSSSKCDELFNRVLTKEGVCYNFNSLSATDLLRVHTDRIQNNYSYLETSTPMKGWSLKGGYDDLEPDPYPKRGRENADDPDMTVILTTDAKEKDPSCNPIYDGFKIYINHPTDMPEATQYYYAALPNQLSSLAVKFSMVFTSESLRNYSPDVRQCYFQKDRQLKYFKIYTQNNCRLECISNYTFQRCNCVWFNMPHNRSDQICTIRQRTCVAKAKAELAVNESKPGNENCKCLPECNTVTYDAEILKTDFHYKAYEQMMSKKFGIVENDSNTYSAIQVYFKEPRFISMRRSELFGTTDFLANCGGLLGLFLGFSFLSLVEIFYFITLRLMCILKNHNISEDIENNLPRPSTIATDLADAE